MDVIANIADPESLTWYEVVAAWRGWRRLARPYSSKARRVLAKRRRR